MAIRVKTNIQTEQISSNITARYVGETKWDFSKGEVYELVFVKSTNGEEIQVVGYRGVFSSQVPMRFYSTLEDFREEWINVKHIDGIRQIDDDPKDLNDIVTELGKELK